MNPVKNLQKSSTIWCVDEREKGKIHFSGSHTKVLHKVDPWGMLVETRYSILLRLTKTHMGTTQGFVWWTLTRRTVPGMRTSGGQHRRKRMGVGLPPVALHRTSIGHRQRRTWVSDFTAQMFRRCCGLGSAVAGRGFVQSTFFTWKSTVRKVHLTKAVTNVLATRSTCVWG